MAKKRKKTKKKSSRKRKSSAKSKRTQHKTPEGFWRQVGVVALFLLALLLIFGAFGSGGPLVEGIFDFMRSSVGYVAFLSPFLLIFLALAKKNSEDVKIPRGTFIGFLVFLISLSGLVHLFIERDQSLAQGELGNGGGIIGHIISGLIVGPLTIWPARIVLFVLSVVSLHFILSKPLTVWLKLFSFKPKKKDKDKITVNSNEDSSEEKSEKKKASFKLNEGVPVQKKKLTSLKNTAEKLTESESHEALTTSTDPEWKFPSLDLLSNKQDKANAGDVEENAENIKATLADFNIDVDMQNANIGPTVTQYTLKPPSGVRLTKITALENNLALNLAATSIRMEAPIPGQRAVGIEVPNIKKATVRLRSILESPEWKGAKSPLSFALGRDIAGRPVVSVLDKMPHMLIAGATGSGKSVMINAFLTSLLYRNSPAELKLILVDPKQVELTPYDDIPHLLTPVITEPEKCISALKWAVAEMERRLNALSDEGKRSIAEYNKVKKEAGMPYIVIVIDELADLMMMAARDVEALIVRLAQKARAVGIHLVLATQRPSVDVITGLIKANVPARVAFTVASQVDSRTILDQGGAEKLLGSGDMLFHTSELPKPKRIQGVFIDDKEVEEISNFLRMEREPEYDDEIVAQPVTIGGGTSVGVGGDDMEDELFGDAVEVVIKAGKGSASLLQRRLRVGYARAARLLDALEKQGVVGPADGPRPRDLLITSLEEYEDATGTDPSDL